MYQRVQRGRGLGGFFSGILKIFSKAAPILKKVAANPSVQKVGKQALKSALSVGASALEGENVKHAASSEFKKTKKKVGQVLKKISNDIDKDRKKKKRYSKIKNSKKRKKASSNLFQ